MEILNPLCRYDQNNFFFYGKIKDKGKSEIFIQT